MTEYVLHTQRSKNKLASASQLDQVSSRLSPNYLYAVDNGTESQQPILEPWLKDFKHRSV